MSDLSKIDVNSKLVGEKTSNNRFNKIIQI